MLKKSYRAVCCPGCKTKYAILAYWFKYVNECCPICGEIVEYTTDNTTVV